MIPSAAGAPRALAIVCLILCRANPVNRQLPDTVFDLRQHVVYAQGTLMCAQARNRCGVIQSCYWCTEPPKCSFFATQDFRGLRNRLRQFLWLSFGRGRIRLLPQMQVRYNVSSETSFHLWHQFILPLSAFRSASWICRSTNVRPRKLMAQSRHSGLNPGRSLERLRPPVRMAHLYVCQYCDSPVFLWIAIPAPRRPKLNLTGRCLRDLVFSLSRLRLSVCTG